jgi:transcriptional regulator NrdR family protein
MQLPEPNNISCPQCGSRKLWRDGSRYSDFGDKIQRWLCRNCGLRFSDANDIKNAWSTIEKVERDETKTVKAAFDKGTTRQICVTETKNLATEQETIEVPCRNENIKGKILEFLWQLKRQNYAEDTLACYGYNIEAMVKLGVNLFDPQSFIDKMTELGDKKTNIRKYNLAKA